MEIEEAKALYDSKFWEPLTLAERAHFQINERRLCMPFPVFHEAEKRNARIELLEAEAVAGRAAIEKLERMVVWMANSGISFTEIPGEVAWFSEEADTMIYIPCDGTAPSILAAVEKAMDKP